MPPGLEKSLDRIIHRNLYHSLRLTLNQTYCTKDFEGEFILFGSPKFPDWKTVMNYLMKFV